MIRKYVVPAIAMTVALAVTPILRADVKTEEKSLLQFGGAFGKVVNFFGGKAAKEGVVSTVAVSGDRKLRATDTSGQIIDLREEKIYDLDMRKKTYTVTTFEELRRKMREMEAKAREEAAKAPKDAQQPPQQPQNEGKQMDVDYDVKDTGQTKTINGFDTRQVIVTITVREKGKKLEDSGGMVMTVDNWLTKSQPALKEIFAFNLRYLQKLEGPQIEMEAQQLATAVAMMPGLKDAFARYSKAELDGTPILTTMTIEGVKSAEQMKEQQSTSQGSGEQGVPTSVGGALGGLMRRRAQSNAEKNPPTARSMFMTINHEVLKIATTVSPADVAIPAGFKLNQ